MYLQVYGIKYNGQECANDTANLTYGAIMYASYLMLFVHFFMQMFQRKKTERKHVGSALKVSVD